jgi:hypothetical protein
MTDAVFTSTQSPEFHELLLVRRQRLVARLRCQRVVHASTIYLIGCTAERDVDRRTVEFERKQLADIESALQRLETGGFGVCARCGHAIRISRLQASPTTRFCRRCPGNGTPRRPEHRGITPAGHWDTA